MRRVTVRAVADAAGATLVRGDAAALVEGFSTDTRALAAGELFISLQGPNFDGNRFARQALEAGAGALLLRGTLAEAPSLAHLPGAAPILVHPDPRRALGDLGAWHRSHYQVPVIGITGSCGKTTTKNIASELIGRRLRVVASPSSFNNDVGVPHTLLLGDEATECFVVELGTNHPGEIAALCRIARPTAGVITNVGASHLEGLGSLEGVAREKGDLAAEDIVFHSGGTTFRLEGCEVTSPLLGTHNVQNLLAALCVCQGLGYALEDVLPGVSTLSGGAQRMERVELKGLTLFDDSYNSNPESSRAAVRFLAGVHGYERRVLVLGDMLELGDLAAELHHALGLEAARAGIDLVVLVGELARAAAAGALEGGLPPEAVLHLSTTADAEREVPALLSEGDVVLVKGSRAMALERVVQSIARGRGES